MAPEIVMNPKSQIGDLIADKTRLIADTLCRLKNLLESGNLKDVQLIGISTGIAFGVYQLVKIKDGYECRRIVIDKDKIVISDIGYPVTNMGHVEAQIECNMDYVLNVSILRMI